MSKHTPGPWEPLKDSYGQLSIFARSIKDFVCGVTRKCEADARLICAAPDLLEALKEMVEMWEDDPSYGVDIARKAHAAIKKAEGK